MSTEEKLLRLQEKITDHENLAEIQKRLGFKDEYGKSTKMPTVLTVTELKRKFNVELTEGASLCICQNL